MTGSFSDCLTAVQSLKVQKFKVRFEWGTSIFREFPKHVTVVNCAGLSRAMHHEVEQAGASDMRCAESSEAYVNEFAEESEALTPENRILWQKFAEIAQT